MTEVDLAALIAQYRAGLEAEISLLHQLEGLAERQRTTSEESNLEGLRRASDEREEVMSSLIGIEQGLAEVRRTLSTWRDQARGLGGYSETVTLHRTASELANRILAMDQESLQALAKAEMARRATAQALDHGEATLAGYRRALTSPAGAHLISRRG
jgi:hypothetical protein